MLQCENKGICREITRPQAVNCQRSDDSGRTTSSLPIGARIGKRAVVWRLIAESWQVRAFSGLFRTQGFLGSSVHDKVRQRLQLRRVDPRLAQGEARLVAQPVGARPRAGEP